jgi:hypothetical protein
MRIPVISVFSLGVGMMHNQSKSRLRRAFGRVLKHFEIAIGIAECDNRLPANESRDPHRFAGAIVDEVHFGELH